MSDRRLPLFCDVDGVLVNPYHRWLERYHGRYPDETPYTIDAIYSSRASADKRLLAMLNEDGFYHDLPPIPGAVEGVAAIRELDYRVIFVTSCVKRMADQKWDWLERHGFLPPSNMQADDLILMHDKLLLTEGILLDDRVEHCLQWSNRFRGTGILFAQPWNRAFEDPERRFLLRAEDWPHVVTIFQAWEEFRYE